MLTVKIFGGPLVVSIMLTVKWFRELIHLVTFPDGGPVNRIA